MGISLSGYTTTTVDQSTGVSFPDSTHNTTMPLLDVDTTIDTIEVTDSGLHNTSLGELKFSMSTELELTKLRGSLNNQIVQRILQHVCCLLTLLMVPVRIQRQLMGSG